MLLYLLAGIILFLVLIKLMLKAFFPNFLNFVMKKVHSNLINLKKGLFKDAFSEVKTKNNGKLEILEIGIGTGENFKYFPENSNITILDKTDIFLPFLKQSIENNNRQDLSVSKLVVNRAEDMKSIESNSMDAIVHTFILCSVDNYEKALDEIYRVLKPGGVAIFIEHSIEQEHPFRRLVQKMVKPMLGDCKFLDMRKVLNSGKYDNVNLKMYRLHSKLFYFMDPMVYGYAQKMS